MAEARETASHSFEVRRTLAARPEEVYKAWTEAALMTRWFSPTADYTVTVHELDLRVGGAYRIEMRHSDGTQNIAYGVYRTLQPPSRIAFTWRWERNAEMPDTMVEIGLVASGAGTELTLVHRLFDQADMRDHHGQGWSGCLDRLAQLYA